MQTCKTGDQPYSDTSPNGECSLLLIILYSDVCYAKRICSIVRPVPARRNSGNSDRENWNPEQDLDFDLWCKPVAACLNRYNVNMIVPIGNMCIIPRYT